MTIVPNFTNGEVVSATKLNQLADAAYKASSILQSPNVGFPWVESNAIASKTFSIRHYSGNTRLHVYVNIISEPADDIDVVVSYVTTPFSTAMNLGAGNTTEGLHKWVLTLPTEILTGEIYQVTVSWDAGDPTGAVAIQFVGESSKITALY